MICAAVNASTRTGVLHTCVLDMTPCSVEGVIDVIVQKGF